MIHKLDIVTSAKNEAENLPELHKRIKLTLETKPEISWRLIICENSSSDNTWDVIQQLSAENNNVIGLKMSRDFGFEGAIAGAFSVTEADAVIMMASDLQDSPEEITKLIDVFEDGYDHVYQIVSDRPGSSWLRNINSQMFYWAANKLSKGLIQPNSSIFRIMSGNMVAQLNLMQERNRFVRALVMYLGFQSKGIQFPRAARAKGQSKASSRHVIGLALKGILSNSYALLDLVGFIGIGVSVLSFISMVVFSLIWIVSGVPFAGFGMITGLILFGFGLVFLCLGIMSQYLSLIYEEVKARPNFVIEETTNLG